MSTALFYKVGLEYDVLTFFSTLVSEQHFPVRAGYSDLIAVDINTLVDFCGGKIQCNYKNESPNASVPMGMKQFKV